MISNTRIRAQLNGACSSGGLRRVACVVAAGYVAVALLGCATRPVPGPDKVFVSQAVGALEGAGAGAITGAQLTAGAGPGAAVGAGFGALVGAIQGFAEDQTEEVQLRSAAQMKAERGRVLAQEVLAEQYKRRLELHPTREIYPADLFFRGDSVKMCAAGRHLVREIARLNEQRLPYSRIVVAAYAKGATPESPFAQYLVERRSREFVNQLVRLGVEPRRLETRAVVTDAPILIDPLDSSTRYNHAIELVPVDR